MCQRDGIQHWHALCQYITGTSIDDAIRALVVDAVSPLALEVSLGIQQELHALLEEADALRASVERVRYDVDLARQRFMRVDPNNPLVADSLEADWNEKLRCSTTRRPYRQQHYADCVDPLPRATPAYSGASARCPTALGDPATPARERKRMLRLIIENVTLAQREGAGRCTSASAAAPRGLLQFATASAAPCEPSGCSFPPG